MANCKVRFLPWDKEVTVQEGTDLITAAAQAGISIYNICGGEGICGRCKVIIKKGEAKSDSFIVLTEEERKKGYVLACRTLVNNDLEVEVPVESRIEKFEIVKGELYTPAEAAEKAPRAFKEKIFTHGPLATKLYLDLPKPTLQDPISDLDRLYREIRKIHPVPVMQMGLANVRVLGRLLRRSDFKLTVTLGKRNDTIEIVLIEPGDVTSKNYGVAVDIGTTTVVAYLVDLYSEKVLATKASYNKQLSFGEDVITRIVFAEDPVGLNKLHEAVSKTVNELIGELVSEAKISLNDINGVMIAGNTTMTHLLLSIPPDYIRREPYVPTASFVPVVRASEAGINISPRGLLACLPSVASYVGGDITAGVLAGGMDRSDALTLLIDLGTNGEIVVGNKDFLAACSCSAGPAFEGVGIKCGIRAMEGAIQRIKVDKKKDFELTCSTIGNVKPKGICGSGLVDIVGEFLKCGIINREGKFELLKSKRIRPSEDGGSEFVIAYGADTLTGKDIVITEADILNLIRSKGAVYMGAHVLLKHMGLKFEDLSRVFVAGGLGTYLDMEKAIFMGLLPDLPQKKFFFVGNTSIAGAKMCLLSNEAYKRAGEIAKKMTYFELSIDPSFMNEYTSTLFLPHTDLNLFPTVKAALKKR